MTANAKPLGLYLHIPFCVRKCAYCDFPSHAGREKDIPAYVDALRGEIIGAGRKWTAAALKRSSSAEEPPRS